jgi:GNAT superfamily N-acetyltransferase
MIRPAKPGDIEAIAKLWEELVAYHRELDAALPVAADDGSEHYSRRIQDSLYNNHTRVLVAEEDGEVVGYILGVLVDLLPEMFIQERGGFVADVYVKPAYRGRGIGRRLVQAIKKWFRSLNVRHFEWYVAAHNPDGIAFWRSVGGRDVMIRMRARLEEDET